MYNFSRNLSTNSLEYYEPKSIKIFNERPARMKEAKKKIEEKKIEIKKKITKVSFKRVVDKCNLYDENNKTIVPK